MKESIIQLIESTMTQITYAITQAKEKQEEEEKEKEKEKANASWWVKLKKFFKGIAMAWERIFCIGCISKIGLI